MPRRSDWSAELRLANPWLDDPGVPPPGHRSRERSPPEFPPTGASAWGQDVYGLWYEFQIADVVQRMRWIPPRLFEMGSPEDEPERLGNETLHIVTLTQGFWLADTACCQALWQTVMGDNPSNFSDEPKNPVETVSWDDVRNFCQALNNEQGAVFTLPSEAQWEYACRAGSRSAFWWGDSLSTEQANYDGSEPYNDGKKGEDRGTTLPVKSFAPNPWGLYQMHGNVWEWCSDWYSEDISGMQTDPQGPGAGERRVLRGGGWGTFGRVPALGAARRLPARQSQQRYWLPFVPPGPRNG